MHIHRHRKEMFVTTPTPPPPPSGVLGTIEKDAGAVLSVGEKVLTAYEDLAPEIKSWVDTVGRHLGIGSPVSQAKTSSQLPPPPSTPPAPIVSADGNYIWNATTNQWDPKA